ncbi:hypothetical protein Patl1_24155 [Pistacia atlantica]|uniref:Uncharacterized protein n=1 Tax=Pistacia atlantica TaxID=434234 RepID=A0ACC0ZXL8_9ROSI|nr:hypothetical protein Patl1_24155 [Pistacia atlantica]
MEPTNESSIPEIVVDVPPQDMNQREARPSSSEPSTSHIVPPGQLSLSLSLSCKGWPDSGKMWSCSDWILEE